MILSLRPHPEPSDDAADWYMGKIVKLVHECGEDAVDAAIDHCLEESRFRPEIADIKNALGRTQKQHRQSIEDAATVEASQAWHSTVEWLNRYMERDSEGIWKRIEDPIRIVRDARGEMVFVTDERGHRAARTESVLVPELPERCWWCVKHIGGPARILECQDKFIEVVRREWIASWPLYEKAELMAISSGEREVAALIERHLAELQPPVQNEVEAVA